MKTGFTLQTAKIVGTPSDECWSQIHSFSPEEVQKKEKRGSLLAILVINGLNEGMESVAIGREVLARLHEEYYGNLEGSAFERLGIAVGKVGLEEEDLEITAVALIKNVLYLACFGEGRILLKRGDKTGTILFGGNGLSKASGFIEEGDLIVLGSKRFFASVGKEFLEDSLKNNNPPETVESIAPKILGRQDMADAAVIFALVNKEEIEEEINLGAVDGIKKPRLFGTGEITVKTENQRKKKKIYFLISLVLLAVLLSGLVFGVVRRFNGQKETDTVNLIKKAEEKFREGKTVFSSKPEEGRKIAQEAENILKDIKDSKTKNDEIALLKKQIVDFLSSSLQEISLNEVSTFMDINLINDGGSGNSLSLIDKHLAILDSGKKKIYLLDIEKKSNRIFDISLENAKNVFIPEDKVLVFSDDGVEEIATDSKKTTKVLGKDDKWGEIVDFSLFGGNLYLLDKKEGDIFRYPGNNGVFGAKKSWFTEPQSELNEAVSFAVDGSVWVLKKDKILKFTLGKSDGFSLSGMPASPPASPRGEQGGPEEFDNPVKIRTSTGDENLYVLDKGRGKIYVIAKTGEFRIAYGWEGIKQADDFAVAKEAKKIFILSGSRIYEIATK